MFHRTRIKHNTNLKIFINNNIVDHYKEYEISWGNY